MRSRNSATIAPNRQLVAHDLQSLEEAMYLDDKTSFPFANAGSGNSYCVKISSNSDSGKVIIKEYDDADVYDIADSLSDFLSWPRRD